MKARMQVIALLALLSAAPLSAQAGVDGRWSGVVSSPQGDQPVTMELKAEGEKLTGTISDFQGGEGPIAGTVAGDTIAFVQTLDFNGTPFTLSWAGRRHGEDLLLAITVDMGNGAETLEFTAKRATPR
jgi:hypothetical protein